MKLLCKILGHNYIYHKRDSNYYRHCTRCNTMEEYRRDLSHFYPGWFILVQFTKQGANSLLKELKDEEQEV